MLELDYEALSALGLTPALAARASALDVEADDAGVRRLARIVELHRETVIIHDGRNAYAARIAPWLFRALADEGACLAVGDWVIVDVDAHGDAWIASRVPPVSHIGRRDADGHSHPIVSNVDVAA